MPRAAARARRPAFTCVYPARWYAGDQWRAWRRPWAPGLWETHKNVAAAARARPPPCRRGGPGRRAARTAGRRTGAARAMPRHPRPPGREGICPEAQNPHPFG